MNPPVNVTDPVSHSPSQNEDEIVRDWDHTTSSVPYLIVIQFAGLTCRIRLEAIMIEVEETVKDCSLCQKISSLRVRPDVLCLTYIQASKLSGTAGLGLRSTLGKPLTISL